MINTWDNYYDEETEILSESEYFHARDHLIGLIEDIYKSGSIEDLEFHLEEVLHVFGLKIPEDEPQLIKKPTTKEQSTQRMLQAWVGYTRAYAEQFCKAS